VSNKALIITDGTDSIKSIARLISDELKGFNVKICDGEKFEGTDILPVDIFFIGCANQSPSSFLYLEEMLSHINFASRKCGVFTVKENTLNYLCSIVKDCEAALASPLLALSKNIETPAFKKWVKSVINI